MLDPFKSNAERYFWQINSSFPQVVPGLEEFTVSACMYEAITFHLAGSIKYKPDFYLRLTKGDLVLVSVVEIKGSKKQKGYASTRSKLVECSAMFPEIVFVEILISNRGIDSVEVITRPPFAVMTFANLKTR